MDWMSNLVAGLFNYKIVDVKETEEKNMCSIELCIAKIYYFSQKNSRKTNSGGHVVYVVNSFHPDMIKDGKLLPPDWTKYGIYYSLPLLLGTYGMFTNKL